MTVTLLRVPEDYETRRCRAGLIGLLNSRSVIRAFDDHVEPPLGSSGNTGFEYGRHAVSMHHSRHVSIDIQR